MHTVMSLEMFDEILIFGALGILAGLLAGMFGIGRSEEHTSELQSHS